MPVTGSPQPTGVTSLEPLTRKQLTGLAGILPALLTTYLVWKSAPRIFADITLPVDDTADRLAFAAHWLLVPALCLLAGVVAVSSRRGFMAGAIDGTRTPANRGLEINLRYNLNTLEQTVLAGIAWTGLSVALPRGQLYLIPAMALLFGVGRATFWIGYLVNPMGRAFGMVLTALPTVIALVWLARAAL
jgi:hypothetical protein